MFAHDLARFMRNLMTNAVNYNQTALGNVAFQVVSIAQGDELIGSTSDHQGRHINF